MSLRRIFIVFIRNYRIIKQFKKNRKEANSPYRMEIYLQKTKRIYDNQLRKQF